MLRRRGIFYLSRFVLPTFYRWAKRAEFLHVITETKTLDVPWVIIIVVVVVVEEVLQIFFFMSNVHFGKGSVLKNGCGREIES